MRGDFHVPQRLDQLARVTALLAPGVALGDRARGFGAYIKEAWPNTHKTTGYQVWTLCKEAFNLPDLAMCTTTPHLYSLFNFPNLRRASFQLYTDSRRQYRTRIKEVAPPAAAIVISAQEFPPADGESSAADAQALLVRLPSDWEPYLQEVAAAAAEVIVQPDVGLDAQAAYLSMSVPMPSPQLPRAIWLEVAHVMELSAYNARICGNAAVPFAFSAGQTFVVTKFTPELEPMRRCEEALQAEGKRPDVGKANLVKARQVAKNYGERPWLFMRYDVRVGARKVAVNWAAIVGRLPACVL